ncbi:RNA pseudouridylate synthase-like protein [Leptomonas pyrrhocoris]|uniref:RNA pseudouridylate synthase-like protein n=1 Tax=Leptomonas pyrrhocoris TaxID=157538 RepID=A0A0N0DXQ6_LEPPY|nr:RNA pseudouridylate synthase-like protein [Leptomonas pyrrhocoris]KPA83232.1 RNA pseudouridylate synthase-like protein [Leptomonas pyrrhocoris]|eukprot:XP_015661671.1 RNA pseudouridylate synthase-like protein [Leptomonas pyrrhocoris]
MPREVRYCRPKSQPAETVLSFFARKFTYLSRDAWKHHLSEGHVFINGAILTEEDYVLQQGDQLRFAPPRSLEPRVDEENIRVLFEDASLLVCAKNGNLPVAEGGRYCENTLIGVLQRRGSGAFHTADTVVGGAVAGCEANKVTCEKMHAYVAADAALTLKAASSSELPDTHLKRTSPSVSPSAKRSREPTPPHAVAALPTQEHRAVPPAAPPTLLTVQRLDKETSGVLVLCRNCRAAKAMASQFESQTRKCSAAVEARVTTSRAAFTNEDFDRIVRQSEKSVGKTYMAVLLGAAPIGATFVVVNYMGTVESHPAYQHDTAHSQLKRLKMCCEPLFSPLADSEGPKEDSLQPTQWGKVACTRVRVLTSSELLGLSCVQVELLTGRSHQIRVHCASLGYPIFGDKLYTSVSRGKPDGCVAAPDAVYLARVRNEDDPFLLVENGAAFGRRVWCRRHLLHATELQFVHPEKHPASAMRFVASPGDFFTRDVRWESPADSNSFQVLLSEAFEQYSTANRVSV